ncbi:hypothetical protein GGI15_004714 [Coemansia interrupta]|uniref:Uncharacterized protein n=1 Tax=Coemansia interrupta TaxID=1126814 RepID=A0A9W8H8H0_9FUNG|nr:hypothetical protein GGI15_004714 [Coemansia interrupta]
MGFMDIFYPDPKKKNRPKYRKSCNCDECILRSRSYGDFWRAQTPLCTCCDCMAMAGQNIAHSHSTAGHVHASHHTCAQTGRQYASSSCCDLRREPTPPPKYSLMPQTTHKVDEFCEAKYYTTPLALARPHVPAEVCRVGHGAASGCACAACSGHSHHGHSHGHREDMYLAMPSSYVPCNR